MTRYYLSENLLKKQPQVLFVNLQSALFVFNEHPIKAEDGGCRGAQIQSDMARLLAMVGRNNRESRLRIYRFMLETMHDDYRFQTTHRLCMDVLGMPGDPPPLLLPFCFYV
jgi:phage anti-repressor protein